MTDKCSICLEDLHSDIGVATPCGHCFHRSCFDSFKTDCASRSDGDRDKVMPRCPVCKRKMKKFYNVFLTFQQRGDDACGAGCADAMKAVATLTGENIRLNRRLREILPLYDELETKVSQTKREKKELMKQMKELDETNSVLLSEWNDAEVQLELVKAKKKQIERRLKETNEENQDLHCIWNELDSQLYRAKSKKKEAKMALKRKADELDGTNEQIARVTREKKKLKMKLDKYALQAEQWRNETSKLRKQLKKLKNKH
uniref:RING-type domain-containing protein n=1 Tax=Trieres chinensis TaxID=1514140 RepID=A0A7S2EQ88_TRICV|mmetsp:Transcript_34026/g.69477  ORF Transcript_34026/g.69477 Transcript_34026/m.69477 type:complete len:258 (+) Transcript_34026:159-932(+)|eukprot:CAMPEP_0183325930 /NCGR_PEP_ID=MMETSP0160_2-20130417/80900_1 /TAXON_ID=2839 ORGANISM="Odontella Sinensis, Strain Grunow 1884" /NCGR_SAMPLE_ID=MMETSP0160_2 /ASSEMBLY_ACC=CAM_ASM_000250 /LENGTH=257 /DNA_ID=CAMNT_0025493823 /DNA_START=87 /DNA_END=860 /DNA_ORIENTATION=-